MEMKRKRRAWKMLEVCMSNTGHKGISRVDDEASNKHGFLVYVGWKGESYHLPFVSDRDYGDKGLDAAIQARNDKEREIGKPRTDKMLRSHVVGVHVEVDGHGNEMVVAQCGNMRRYFSTKKVGIEKARMLAFKEREAMEKEYFGLTE
jgi:hypothetical protein